jgi:hypothetical protein
MDQRPVSEVADIESAENGVPGCCGIHAKLSVEPSFRVFESGIFLSEFRCVRFVQKDPIACPEFFFLLNWRSLPAVG